MTIQTVGACGAPMTQGVERMFREARFFRAPLVSLTPALAYLAEHELGKARSY